MADFRVGGPRGPEFDGPSESGRSSYDMHNLPEARVGKGSGTQELLDKSVKAVGGLPDHPKSMEAFVFLQARALGEGYGSF